MEEGNSTPKRTSVAERATDCENAAVVPLTNNPVTVTPSSRIVSKSFRACSMSEAEAKTANGEVVEPPNDKVKVVWRAYSIILLTPDSCLRPSL